MRIITGNFKGRKLLTPNDIKTRPLKDLTKESIFNILKHSNKFKVEIKNLYISYQLKLLYYAYFILLSL